MSSDYSNLTLEALLEIMAARTLEYNKMLHDGVSNKEQVKEVRHQIKALIGEYTKRLKLHNTNIGDKSAAD